MSDTEHEQSDGEGVAPDEDEIFGGGERDREPPQRNLGAKRENPVDLSIRAPTHLRGSTAPAIGAPFGFKKDGKPRLRRAREFSDEEKAKLAEHLKNPAVIERRLANAAKRRAHKQAVKTAQVTGDDIPPPPEPKTRTVVKREVVQVGLKREEVEALLQERLTSALDSFEERRQQRKQERKKKEADELAAKARAEEEERERQRVAADEARAQRRRALQPALKRTNSGSRLKARFADSVI